MLPREHGIIEPEVVKSWHQVFGLDLGGSSYGNMVGTGCKGNDTLVFGIDLVGPANGQDQRGERGCQ